MDGMRCGRIFVAAFAALAAAFAAPGGAAAKTVVDGIAIVVNDTVVTLSEYRRKAERIRRQEPEMPKDKVVQTVIGDVLVKQAAAKNKIEVSGTEIREAISRFKQSLDLDDAGLVAMLGEKNYTFNEFFEDMKFQILTTKLVQSEVARRGLLVDDEKIEAVYRKINPGADTSAQVRIAHILVPNDSGDSLGEARELAETARSEGANFARLAEDHSVDARTANDGGDLGYFKYDELIGPLRKAVEGAEPGDVNGPVVSRAGLHIVKVLSIKPEGVLIPAEVKEILVEELAMKEAELIISSIIEKGFETSHIDTRI